MFRLISFGSLALLQDGTPHAGPVGQRRRLLLLAFLAASGPRGVTRDRVLALFWPDDERDAARHSLDQTLHLVRRAVGVEAVRGTGTLVLDPGGVGSDVAEFDTAVERGAYDTAARLYAGPFLDGVDAPRECDELARWGAAARERRAREHAAALARLAADATARRDHAGAVYWTRRHVALEPLDTSATCALIDALVAAGDGAGALRAALLHERLVRAELEIPPDPEIRAWIVRLRVRVPDAAPGVDAARGAPVGVPIGAPIGSPGREPWREIADVPLGTRSSWEDGVRDRLGSRYELGAIARGGAMVTTFDARDRRSTDLVRLHVLAPHRATGGGRASEAVRVLARVAALHGQRVEAILDCDAADGLAFYVTAPAVGTSLRDRLAVERALGLDDAVRIGTEIADALAEAEAAGVAHGDLRPKHVRLGPGGVRLSGLGVVQALDALGRPDDASTAVTVGAPAYLSPEQVAGAVTADARSDVYALGCLLFEMLAGEPPFGRGSALGMLTRKLHERPPSLRARRAGIPAALDDVVARALAPVPADRPRSAAELGVMLRRAGAADAPASRAGAAD